VVLYLVRHAIAEERGPEWPDDTTRPLSTHGITRMRDVVRGLGTLKLPITRILTSPLVRARQTADLLHDGLASHPPVEILHALAAGATPAAVLTALSAQPAAEHLALVGHEPDLGHLAARLIGTRRPIPFRKGAVCCIEIEGIPTPGAGALLWFAPPRLLRRLA
jgi:phosphohistidine phosphatase